MLEHSQGKKKVNEREKNDGPNKFTVKYCENECQKLFKFII